MPTEASSRRSHGKGGGGWEETLAVALVALPTPVSEHIQNMSGREVICRGAINRVPTPRP